MPTSRSSMTQRAEFEEGAPPEVAWQTLELLRTAVLLISEDDTVIWMSAEARTVIESGRIRIDENGQLVSSRANDELRALIRRACTPAPGVRPACAGVIRIDHSLQLAVIALRRVANRCIAAVFLSSPSLNDGDVCDSLRRFYGLTRMEARLAAKIVCGAAPAEAAEALGIGISTARSHLRAIFAKTNTHSQAELVRFLTSGLGMLKVNEFLN